MSTKERKAEMMTEISPNILVITVKCKWANFSRQRLSGLQNCHLCPQTLYMPVTMPHILLCSIYHSYVPIFTCKITNIY